MSLIDELLGPVAEHVIDDGEGGQWIIEIRPRRSGPPVLRTTSVRFRRPERRNGFGLAVYILREVARIGNASQDSILNTSIGLTQTSARNAIAWLDHFKEGA